MQGFRNKRVNKSGGTSVEVNSVNVDTPNFISNGNVDHTVVGSDIVSNVDLSGKADTNHTHTKSDITDFNDADYATAAQGSKADTAVQPAQIADFETSTELDNRDTANRDRANHTGTQLASTVTGLSSVATSGDYNDLSNTPDLSGFDNIDFYDSQANFPATGDSGDVLYLAKDTGLLYRWDGSAYVVTSGQLALGETSNTAYRGDRGKIAYDHSQLITGNPHVVTKTDVGLGNVDNTSDANKPVSTAQQTALDAKQNTLVSGTNIKTLNNESLLGSGNITISGGGTTNNYTTTYERTEYTITTTGTSENFTVATKPQYLEYYADGQPGILLREGAGWSYTGTTLTVNPQGGVTATVDKFVTVHEVSGGSGAGYAMTQQTEPTPANGTAVTWVASGSGTKDGTTYVEADVLMTSVNQAGVSKTVLVLDHSTA